MNESILKALMRLFAIVADVYQQNRSDNERDIVMDYLERQYSDEIVNKFLDYFDEQVKIFHAENINESEELRNLNLYNNTIITGLCKQINEELEQHQKLIVLIYLLDFINRGDELSRSELKFVSNVALQLKIKDDEFSDARAFTFGELDKLSDKSRLLFIDEEEESEEPEIKHMPTDKLEGRITVLHLPSANTYIFRYYGHMQLYLNGHNIKPNRSYIWSIGSVIKNSKIESLYFSRMAGKFIQAGIENKFVFTATNIEYSYRNSQNGLKRFSFTEDSSRLIGIIGGSGCGKSTLLNILNGNIKPKNGNIRINGHDIHTEKEILEGVIGFVPQDDLLIKELSVFQNLYYNAKLCFSTFSEDKIKEIVELALVDFDLVEARDLNVGDSITTILSGGQRKRLNIALELIREPSILFIDEPTSGLSSSDSEKVITLLKRQTLKGKLVITNIHQPSSDIFKMFDKILVMDQGGRVIYYGNPATAITYFKKAAQHVDSDQSECLSCGNINAEQILRIVEARMVDANGRLTRKRKTTPEEWYQRYLKNIDPEIRKINREHDESVPKSNFKIPKRLKQIGIFLERDILAKLKNSQYLFINLLEAPLLASILAFFTKKFTFIDGIPKYIFGENTNMPAYIFMAVIVALFMGLVISAEEIFKDRILLKREKFLNLSRSSYLFSKIAILFSISAIQTILFVLIGNYILQINGLTFYYWVMLFTASCWANTMGLNISAGLNSVVTIYVLVPIILVPQLLFSGVVVDFDKMHNKIAAERNVPIIGDLMVSRWAYEGIMVAQFKDNRFERKFYNSDKQISNAIFYKSYGIDKLRSLNSECVRFYYSNDTDRLQQNLSIIKKEIVKICKSRNWIKPYITDSLELTYFKPENTNAVFAFLNVAELNYVLLYNKAVSEREARYDKLVKKLGGNNNFITYKQKYHNQQVALVVTNEKELSEYNIQNTELIRTKDAVFRTPESSYGRAHFYAPVKILGSVVIPTFWYNVIVIWLYSILMFVVLYYDVLRKIITYFESVRLSRSNRLRFMRLLKVYEQQTGTKS